MQTTPTTLTPPQRPLILVTNDDGIDTPGIQELAHLMEQRGTVVVVAPRDPQSGQSQAVTVGQQLSIQPFTTGRTATQYYVTGTPTDCVKVALHAIMPRRPDLVVSGINFGSNASINSRYSGTVGAAMEAAISGIPSIAFSMVRKGLEGGYEPYHPYCLYLVDLVLSRGLPWGVTLNVNLPRKPVEGLRWARQSGARWVCYRVTPDDPAGQDIFTPPAQYTIGGTLEELEPDASDVDIYMLRNRYVSVVPTQADPTHFALLNEMKDTIWRPKE